MIVFIAGGTHTGKTVLAQKLLEKHRYPYLSIDHLKMGMIRSEYCPLSPESSNAKLTEYLWPIVREIVKTAMENQQNLIVEGCYIPFDYAMDFQAHDLERIRYICLILSENYIQTHFDDIIKHACDVEHRMYGDATTLKQTLLDETQHNVEQCKTHGLPYLWIDNHYQVDWDLYD